MTNDKRTENLNTVEQSVEELFEWAEESPVLRGPLLYGRIVSLITAERRRAEAAEKRIDEADRLYVEMLNLRDEEIRKVSRLESRLQEAEAENKRLKTEHKKTCLVETEKQKITELEKELASAKELWADAQSACKKHALRADELEKEVERLKLAEDFDSSLLDDSNKKLIDYRKKIKELEARLAETEKDKLPEFTISEERQKKIERLEASLSRLKKLLEWIYCDGHGREVFPETEVFEAVKDALASLEGDKLQGGRE